ncbi:MAG: hypothetical protein Q9M09_06315 [Mariprofundaceae bacterium]|nr:hypothetical protein [Mariprofundaceae bacterium]
MDMEGKVSQTEAKPTLNEAPQPQEPAPVVAPAVTNHDEFNLDSGDELSFDSDDDKLVFDDSDKLDFSADEEPLSVEGLDDSDMVLPDTDEGTESTPINPAQERAAGYNPKKVPLDDIGEKSTDTQFEKALSTIQAPKLKKHRIWPWISLILIIFIAAGLWVKRDAWMHQPMVRSLLLQTGLSKTASGTDWYIDPAAIQPRWSKDDQGKSVLIIAGHIQNRLTLALPIPMFEVRFDDPQSKPIVLPSILPNHVAIVVGHPVAPDVAWTDHEAVAGGELHPFTLVMHNVASLGSQKVAIRAVAGK